MGLREAKMLQRLSGALGHRATACSVGVTPQRGVDASPGHQVLL